MRKTRSISDLIGRPSKRDHYPAMEDRRMTAGDLQKFQKVKANEEQKYEIRRLDESIDSLREEIRSRKRSAAGGEDLPWSAKQRRQLSPRVCQVDLDDSDLGNERETSVAVTPLDRSSQQLLPTTAQTHPELSKGDRSPFFSPPQSHERSDEPSKAGLKPKQASRTAILPHKSLQKPALPTGKGPEKPVLRIDLSSLSNECSSKKAKEGERDVPTA